jgi:endo-alpha-1,4-polygalactosaminidase (GH114 family)
MKYKLIIIFIILSFVCIAIIVYLNMNKKPNILQDISDYRIYYRKIDESILQSMSEYDLNIVEGSFFEEDDVKFLKENNSKVIGYYSVMEIGSWDTSLIEKLNDSDYLEIDGDKVLSKSEKNYIGDISQAHFQDALIEAIEKRIIVKGMDGLFLDTLDWLDYYKEETALYEKLLDGYSGFLKKLKDKYPDLIIIQNRGFNCYERVSYKFIDGILWENFSSPYLSENTTKIDTLERFAKIARRKNTVVFTISFDAGVESSKLSEKLGWKHLQSQMKNRYSSWDIETHK